MKYLFSSTDENLLRALFQAKAAAQPGSVAYYHARDSIVSIILQSLHEQLRRTRDYWVLTQREDPGECESLINLSVLRAVDSYDMSRGNCKFSSFLWTVINQSFWRYRRDSKRFKRYASMVSIDADPECDENSTYVDEKELTSPDISNSLAQRVSVEHLYANTSLEERTLLDGLLRGETYSQIGQALEVSTYKVWSMVQGLKKRFSYLA